MSAAAGSGLADRSGSLIAGRVVRAPPHQGGRSMAETTEAFVGIDVAKLRNAVAVADAGRDGEVRFYGEVGAFLLRHSRLFPRKKNWGARYRSWLETQSFEHPADQIVLQEGIESVRLAEERLARLDRAIGEFLPTWSLAPLVEALQALRGVDLVTAVTFVVEVGDIRRFESPRQLMGYLGPV